LEGKRVRTVDGEVRVIRADVPSRDIAFSHTLHSVRPSVAGSEGLAESSLNRRERLIAAAVETASGAGVDRLVGTRDTAKAL
jgi:hypothetical protein